MSYLYLEHSLEYYLVIWSKNTLKWVQRPILATPSGVIYVLLVVISHFASILFLQQNLLHQLIMVVKVDPHVVNGVTVASQDRSLRNELHPVLRKRCEARVNRPSGDE